MTRDFRAGTFRGTPLAVMRHRALRRTSWRPTKGELLFAAALAAGGFLIGRRWAQQRREEQFRETQKRYLQGVDILGAR